MTKKAYFLTEEDADLLRDLLKREKERRVNSSSRRGGEVEIGGAPEVYIAVPKTAAGIPALSQPGTGTGSGPAPNDIPGSADCDIYRIVSGLLEPIASGAVKTVYNLSKTAIPQQFFLASRTKSGAWVSTEGLTVASLTVKEVDGTPTITSVATLSFDQVDGFAVTDSGGGVARIDLLPVLIVRELDGIPSVSAVSIITSNQAQGLIVTGTTGTANLSILDVSKTQTGVVNLSAQVMGDGAKTFSDAVIVNNDLGGGALNAFNVKEEAGAGNSVIKATTANDSINRRSYVTIRDGYVSNIGSVAYVGPALDCGGDIVCSTNTSSHGISMASNTAISGFADLMWFRQVGAGAWALGVSLTSNIDALNISRPTQQMRAAAGWTFNPAEAAENSASANVTISGTTLRFRGGLFVGLG